MSDSRFFRRTEGENKRSAEKAAEDDRVAKLRQEIEPYLHIVPIIDEVLKDFSRYWPEWKYTEPDLSGHNPKFRLGGPFERREIRGRRPDRYYWYIEISLLPGFISARIVRERTSETWDGPDSTTKDRVSLSRRSDWSLGEENFDALVQLRGTLEQQTGLRVSF